MSKLKLLFRSWKVWLLIVAILFAVIALSPNPFAKGVEIQSIDSDSTASTSGLEAGMTLKSISGATIKNQEDFASVISSIKAGDIVEVGTNKGTFKFLAEEINGTIDLGLSVGEVKTSKLKLGIDIAGGVRALLKPAEKVSDSDMQDIILITEKRLNTYGISDITVRQVSDLEGNDYILVEVPGANKGEVASLLQKQGKFEAKIGNDTVFRGGQDIKGVCRTPDCSGINPNEGCGKSGDQWVCSYEFRVDISPEAAKKHADITRNLNIILENGQQYLDKKLDLFLDDELVNSLFISADLKGSESTSFVIQGPGTGATKQEAQVNTLNKMQEMQTVLISGSLPVKLEIAKMDIISPTLGENFLQITFLAMGLAFLAVGIVVFVRFKKLKISLPIIFTCVAETIIILGLAAWIKWRLDLASIAGIIAAIGTGVDNQIVIADEVLSGEVVHDWKQRIKNAFFVIFVSYSTIVVAMLPLWWMGAGLVKGFAVTTILGATAGVFIARPAFAAIITILLKEDEE